MATHTVLTAPPLELPRPVAGLDEVGRGPLAGNVVACAVILPDDFFLKGLTDSKKLSEARRDALAIQIREAGVVWAIGEATPEEIDSINILQATFLAMRRAIAGLSVAPAALVVDGNHAIPGVDLPQLPVVKGDGKILCIAAASILAKTHRDAQLVQLDQEYPQYGFAAHKGYPTAAHQEALQRFGPTPAHRRSFAPVARQLGFPEWGAG